MTFTLADGRRVHLIGDPHLGRDFDKYAPTHRRGERALHQALHFSAELDAQADIVVQVGDLFDFPEVSREVILAAARSALSGAERNPDVLFFHMAGNHDRPRNLSKIGAWTFFKMMVEDRLPNLIVVDRPLAAEGLAFFPWEWDRTAVEQVKDVENAQVEHAIGHWDLSVFDGKDDHLVPVAALRAAFGDIGIWSGHYHKPGPYTVDGHTIQCTGSMEPYAHGEGDLYVTLTRAEALARDDLRNLCVRVLLAPGEDLPEIDCLQLTHKREGVEEDVEQTVSSDDFDFPRLVKERIRDRDPLVRSFIEERMSLNVGSEEQRRGGDQAV